MDERSVFIVDDDPGMRKALSFLLTANQLTVRSFDSAEAFLSDCPANAAGCVLLDMRMSGMDGLQLQAQLLKRGVRMPVIFLTGHGDVPSAVQAIADGAVDFLEKPCDEHRLLASIERALGKVSEQEVVGQEEKEFRARLGALSLREREVMSLLVVGKSTKHIATQLRVSVQAVDKHRNRVLDKMGGVTLIELSRLVERFAAEQDIETNIDSHGDAC
jgi:two-component system, LuxR family, response regulator FixJ